MQKQSPLGPSKSLLCCRESQCPHIQVVLTKSRTSDLFFVKLKSEDRQLWCSPNYRNRYDAQGKEPWAHHSTNQFQIKARCVANDQRTEFDKHQWIKCYYSRIPCILKQRELFSALLTLRCNLQHVACTCWMDKGLSQVNHAAGEWSVRTWGRRNQASLVRL